MGSSFNLLPFDELTIKVGVKVIFVLITHASTAGTTKNENVLSVIASVSEAI